jgi:hypothetical protein
VARSWRDPHGVFLHGAICMEAAWELPGSCLEADGAHLELAVVVRPECEEPEEEGAWKVHD